LRHTLDKGLLVRAAIQAAVPVPRTLTIHDAGDLAAVPQEVGFPCVLKPVSSVHWRMGGNWDLVGGKKGFRVDGLQQLSADYRRLSAVHPEVLVQEWIPGPVENIAILGGYVGQNSQLLAYFTARKIVQAPEDCGTGCVVESVEIPELLQPSLRLFQALHYSGMAEVEYKRDAADGKLKLIEINTRHWDQHRLGQASGINLTWTAYSHYIGRPLIPQPRPVQRRKWVAEDAFLLYAAAGLWHRQLGLSQLRRQLSGGKMYGIFSWKDPLPFLSYFAANVLPTTVRAACRKIWKGMRGK
jgi:predicted ATP-grasp superfamily ATP-dependent carboligase